MADAYKPLSARAPDGVLAAAETPALPTVSPGEKDSIARDLLAAMPALEKAMDESLAVERERKSLEKYRTLALSEPSALRRNPLLNYKQDHYFTCSF